MSGLFVPWVPLPLIPKAEEQLREVQMEKTTAPPPPRRKDYNERIREKQAEKKAAKEGVRKVTTQSEMLQDLV